MRKEFSNWMENVFVSDPNLIFLTGDLGFTAFEKLANLIGNRFVNTGVSEQNMVSLAAGLAQQGLSPFCYSIAPFMVFRAAEQIRLDACIHHLNVKIVGNGGGYGYGIMGATHHALEDIAFISSLNHMKCFVPYCNEVVHSVCNQMISYSGPSYLRLGAGVFPKDIQLPSQYSSIQQLAAGDQCTVVGLGPVLLNIFPALTSLKISADVFAITEMPIEKLSTELIDSLKKTRHLLVLEEHVQRGGCGENLSWLLMKSQIPVTFSHQYAKWYPNGLYGSQKYHQTQSGLDSDSLTQTLKSLIQK